MTKFCPKCGTSVGEEAIFCGKCGAECATEMRARPKAPAVSKRETLDEGARRLREAVQMLSGAAGIEGDREQAWEIFSQLSEEGDPLAKMWVALCLSGHHGTFNGFTEDKEGARSIARTTIDRVKEYAESGNTEAQYLLGQAYWYGLGIDRNLTLAREWLLKAAERGHLAAMEALDVEILDDTAHFEWHKYRYEIMKNELAKIKSIESRGYGIMSKFCPKCGTSIKDEAVFCGKCGAKCGNEVEQQPKAAVTPKTEALEEGLIDFRDDRGQDERIRMKRALDELMKKMKDEGSSEELAPEDEDPMKLVELLNDPKARFEEFARAALDELTKKSEQTLDEETEEGELA